MMLMMMKGKTTRAKKKIIEIFDIKEKFFTFCIQVQKPANKAHSCFVNYIVYVICYVYEKKRKET